MKRLLRRTFVATSLLLGIVSLTLWGVSYIRIVGCVYTSARDEAGLQRSYCAGPLLGLFLISWASEDSHSVAGAEFPKSGMYVTREIGAKNLLTLSGLRYSLWFHCDRRQGNGYRASEIQIPLWLPVAVFSIFPLWTLRTHLRARREKKKGLCPQCGYDLRATPQRCPECGAIASSTPDHKVSPS